MLALNGLAEFEDSQLFDFLAGEAKKSINDVHVVDAAIQAMSRAIPPNKENVYEEYSKQEIDDFIESLTQEQFKNIQTFFETMPKLSHTVKYKCEKCSREETIVLEGLQSFFT